jgi:hypothetical protein
VLTAFDVAGGSVAATVRLGVPVPHFAAPTAAIGLVLIGTERGVAALRRG